MDLAHAITPQVAFTGEVLPAACPSLAAGISAGEVSGEHARIVLDTLGKLPGPVRRGTPGRWWRPRWPPPRPR